MDIMVGNLLSRTRQLTSEANIGRSELCIMKIGKKNIMSISIILLIILIFATSTYAAQGNILRFGSRGSEVSRLQQSLNNRGFSAGKVDGIYGPITENAVIQFQLANKLIVDGIAGNQTFSALYSISNNTYSTNLYWLSRIIHAEAGAEPYRGKVAVGSVVLNRVKSNLFPNTVKGIIFDYDQGIPQFCPVEEGTIYNTPSAESVQAAKDALNGVKPVGNSTYFFNPSKSSGQWIVNNKAYVTRIGNHVFYR